MVGELNLRGFKKLKNLKVIEREPQQQELENRFLHREEEGILRGNTFLVICIVVTFFLFIFFYYCIRFIHDCAKNYRQNGSDATSSEDPNGLGSVTDIFPGSPRVSFRGQRRLRSMDGIESERIDNELNLTSSDTSLARSNMSSIFVQKGKEKTGKTIFDAYKKYGKNETNFQLVRQNFEGRLVIEFNKTEILF
eukprot:maker-scaffold_55-snap-gene-1.2-mRNA-1 protein AED:0.07 eAED:0.76 QI:0/0/0.33/1/0/0/3/194/193